MKKLKIFLSLSTIATTTMCLSPLTNCSQSKYAITNESIGVTFTNLPTNINRNTSFSCDYTIDDPSHIVDETKSDILVNKTSIKSSSGVLYTEGKVVIPSELVTGDIVIKIITKKDTNPIPVVNESDSDIQLYDYPQSTYKGVEIKASYTVSDLKKKLDIDNSVIVIGNKQYTGSSQIQYTQNTITIPANLVTGTVTFKLKSIGIDYNIKNESDSNIKFDNLPSTIKSGMSLYTQYTISNDQIVSYKNSEIKSGETDIKSASSVFFEDGVLDIPSMHIDGDLTIKLVLKDRQHLTVTNTGDEHLSISVPSAIDEKRELVGSYTIDDNYELNRAQCEIKSGDITITDNPGIVLNNNQIKIPAHLVKGNISITLKSKLVRNLGQTWNEIITACNDYEADTSATREKTFYEKFTINGVKATSMDDLIGTVATVKLFLYETTEEEPKKIYQEYKVRVIAHDHDDIWDEQQQKVIGKSALTFESVNLVSDQYGDVMKMYYHYDDPSDIISYVDSDIYLALNSENTLLTPWKNKQCTETAETRSTLTMLNQWDENFVKGIKTTSKSLSKYNGTEYELVNQKFKLFPLTISELDIFDLDIPQEGTKYPFYESKPASERIKFDLNSSVCSYWTTSPFKTWSQELQKYLATQACFIQNDGIWAKNDGRYAAGVSFAFNI